MNIHITEPTHTIDYFVKGWEADNQKEGYTNRITYNYITKDLTNYINTISTQKNRNTSKTRTTSILLHKLKKTIN